MSTEVIRVERSSVEGAWDFPQMIALTNEEGSIDLAAPINRYISNLFYEAEMCIYVEGTMTSDNSMNITRRIPSSEVVNPF